MRLKKFDSSPNDLARPGIVVLVIKAVHAERMVHEVQSNVAVDRFRDETIEGRFQIWNLIPSCSRDEHRWQLRGTVIEVSDRGELLQLLLR